MNFLAAFRDQDHAPGLLAGIKTLTQGRTLRFMEVCGGHTMAIWRYGLPGLLGENITLLSGPGCPVCVTPNEFLDRAIALSKLEDTITVTFGDLMRVPGSSSDLQTERSRGSDIRTVYSARGALDIARSQPDRVVIFLGIGFETTAPTIAATLLDAHRDHLDNFRVLSTLKTMPRALRAIAAGGEIKLDGLILPGHVSAITGSGIYEFLAEEFHLPCVISGFEPLDILQSITMLSKQATEGRAQVEIQYGRSVRPQGNRRAQEIMDRVFATCDAQWRGLGVIAGSGLSLRDEFHQSDAIRIPALVEPPRERPGCRCGDVIRGAARPEECSLFATACRPENPIGACMVSEEGTCAAHFNYKGIN